MKVGRRRRSGDGTTGKLRLPWRTEKQLRPLFLAYLGAGLDDRLGGLFCRAFGGVCLCVAPRRLGLGPRGPSSGDPGGNRRAPAAATERFLSMNVQEHPRPTAPPFRPWLLAHDFEAIDPWIEVRGEGLPEIGRFLRDERDLAFDMLHCITAVDYFQPDAKKAAQVDWQPHVELIYHLSSTRHRHRLVLKVRLPRWRDDEPGQLPRSRA